MRPVILSKDVRDQILAAIPSSFNQAYRLINFLADNPQSVTVNVNRACAVGNISDVARKINGVLWKFGVIIGCERPSSPVPNRFGEPSHMFLWSIMKPEEAANDPGFSDDLKVRP